MKRHLKSRNPGLNVPRRHEAVATDTVYCDTTAVHSGAKQAQLFVGNESLVSYIYPTRSGKQFVNTLEDNICRCGSMDKLISDSAKIEISHKIKDILRPTTSVIGSLNHTIRIKPLLNGGIEPSRPGPSPSCVTSLTSSPQHHLVAKLPFKFCMMLPLISGSYSYTPFISLSSMLHMISIFLLIVKKGLVSGLVLLSIR